MRGPSKEYREYLQSLRWLATRDAALARACHKCQRCGATKNLEVHHKHYKSLGQEKPEDLEVLCIPCHDEADVVRRRRNHWEAGLNTFATKKYGEDWASTGDWDLIAEEFDEWRERRENY
jgi:5-methylcytosine-specific restriction endonuclease McrA